METRCLEEVSKILIEVGKLVEQRPEENSVELRQIIKNIEAPIQETGNRHLIFLSYFLSFFIEDVWSNVAMDATYKISDRDIRAILSSIGANLVKIGEDLERKKYYECYEDYTNLLNIYLNDIGTIREKIGE